MSSITDRLTSLWRRAFELVRQRQRPEETIALLINALELFIAGKLVGVLSLSKDLGEVYEDRQRERRMAFYRQNNVPDPQDGVDLANNLTLFGFPSWITTSFLRAELPPIRDFLLWSRAQVLGAYPENGRVVLDAMEPILANHGLGFGMIPEEIEEAFGPPPGH